VEAGYCFPVLASGPTRGGDGAWRIVGSTAYLMEAEGSVTVVFPDGREESRPSLPTYDAFCSDALKRLRAGSPPLATVRDCRHRFIIFCDDLSFDHDDTSYKSLKAVLEGGIEGRPANVLFYATSNRRHLMPRDMIDNERSTAINPSEAIEEKVSLSDRFGLWLGFHHGTQDQYFDMVRAYARYHKLGVDDDRLIADAVEWSMTRGSRSGRVAWQFIQDLAGRLGKALRS
jgi:hypothetical protein